MSSSLRPIAIDIETLGLELTEKEKNEMLAECSAPSNYKDVKKIQAYIADAFKKKMERLALSPLTGRIVCIAVADLWGDGEPRVCFEREDEREILEWFLDQWSGRPICGFNIRDFDLPFINFRMKVHRLKMPYAFPYQKYTKGVFDLRDVVPEGNLNSVLLSLGLPGKIASGADVNSMLDEEVIRYSTEEMRSLVQALELFAEDVQELRLARRKLNDDAALRELGVPR